MKYIVNESIDPYFNLALENYILENKRDDVYILLWRNDNSIIIGKNQNTIEQINMEYVKEKGIRVARRMTGGGAVYHDLNNLNFSIISDAGKYEEINFSVFTRPVIEALKKLGVKSELTGRNDLTIDGKKFTGVSQRVHRGRVLNNGCIMFDVDTEILGCSLQVRSDKIASKGVKSVKSRVTNIRPYLEEANGKLSVLEFRDLLLRCMFEDSPNGIEICELTPEELEEIKRDAEERFSTWEWNYGHSPKCNYENYRRFEGVGSVEVKLQIEDGRIATCNIYGDFFGVDAKEDVEKALKGVRYDCDDVSKILNGLDLTRYFGKLGTKDFLSVLFEQ